MAKLARGTLTTLWEFKDQAGDLINAEDMLLVLIKLRKIELE